MPHLAAFRTPRSAKKLAHDLTTPLVLLCRAVVVALFLFAALALGAGAQTAVHRSVADVANAKPLASAAAVVAERAPVLDGADSDAVWLRASVVSDFRMYDPVENGEPTVHTSARIAYDARNIYIFVYAFDARPDSIVSLLSRRDVKTSSDQIKVMIDSYRDGRTGYEFAVNPAGVKRDYYIYDDAREDISWDGVWDVATRTDSLGWAAEFRIPLSQLRYTASGSSVFGLMITREVARSNEKVSWPALYRSRPGISSQFGAIEGLHGLSAPRRVELMPYAVARNVREASGGASGGAAGDRAHQVTIGGDARVGIGPNLTLSAAINPDFGQVEADPAVLNLTAFEVSLAEMRPFFVEGSAALGRNQTLFYSRRIGRAPQLGSFAADGAVIPGSTRIIGAAKLTGRTTNGLTLGTLAAITARENAGETTVEPATLYALTRLNRDFKGGLSGVSVTGTAVRRDLDDASSTVLRESAFVFGVDGRHRFAEGRFNVTGRLLGSTVRGSADAIARTQRATAHNFQRTDGELDYDATRTSLNGLQADASITKVSGAVQYGATYSYLTPGFETNDLGLLPRADFQAATGTVSLQTLEPRGIFRNGVVRLSAEQDMNARGMPLTNYVEAQADVDLRGGASVQVTTWMDQITPSYCDRCSRGGPVLRLSSDANILINLTADARKQVVPYVAYIYTVADGGRSRLWRVRPLVSARFGTNVSLEFGARYQKNLDNTQWVTNRGAIGADTTHYIFGRLDQDLLSFTARLNVTLTPTLSLQYYAEPFVSTGHYTNFRDLADGRAADYDARFRPSTMPPTNADFNVKEFNSNAVLRWEYRPGSAIYAVWQQGRDQDDRNAGAFDATRDYQDLFGTRPNNTFLIKASYWVSF